MVHSQVLLLISCVTTEKCLRLSVSQFPHLQKGDSKNAYLTEL